MKTSHLELLRCLHCDWFGGDGGRFTNKRDPVNSSSEEEKVL